MSYCINPRPTGSCLSYITSNMSGLMCLIIIYRYHIILQFHSWLLSRIHLLIPRCRHPSLQTSFVAGIFLRCRYSFGVLLRPYRIIWIILLSLIELLWCFLTVTEFQQERKYHDRTKIGPFFDFLLNFSIFYCNFEHRKLKKGPILLLS